jgi:hypothetical protein
MLQFWTFLCSIEVGKLADFVVLDKNPLEVDPETLDQIKVTETIMEGVTVFALASEASSRSDAQNGTRVGLTNLLLALGGATTMPAPNRTAAIPSGGIRISPPCSSCVCGALSRLADVTATGEAD